VSRNLLYSASLCSLFLSSGMFLSSNLSAEKIYICRQVNKESITNKDIAARLVLFCKSMNIPYSTSIEQKMNKSILETLTLELLQLQELKRVGMEATEDQVKQMVSDVAEKNGTTYDKFVASLKGEGVYYTFVQQLKVQFLWWTYIRKRYQDIAAASKKEVISLIESLKKQKQTQRVKVSEIYLPGLENDNKENAELFAAQIRTGKSFDLIARSFSKGLTASNGGALEARNIKTFSEPVQKAIQETQKGQIIGPLQLNDGYAIYRIDEKSNPSEVVTLYHMAQISAPSSYSEDELKDFDACKDKESLQKLTSGKFDKVKSMEKENLKLSDLSPELQNVLVGKGKGEWSKWINTDQGLVRFLVLDSKQSDGIPSEAEAEVTVVEDQLARKSSNVINSLTASAYIFDIKPKE
jgi:parvulin-like peptidyl-prolyl isomerase